MKNVFLVAITLLTTASTAFACDPCALYNVSRLQGHSPGAFTVSLSEQYTNFDRANSSPENSIRDGELVRGFSTTQVALAYDLTKEFGIQATLPLITRRFDKIEHYRSETKSDEGIGDASLVGTYSFINYRTSESMLVVEFTAGIKIPTGDTGVLKDVSTEEDEEAVERSFLKHHQIGSASGGRALTFGTGSYDYIVGLNLISRYQRYLAVSSAQYTVRTEGDFNYEFADDFLMSAGAGYYLALGDDFTLAGIVVLTGEFKGKDHLDSELVSGSNVSNLYVGPQLLFTLNEAIGGELGVDFRVTDEDEEATVVPTTRMRASMSYRF